MTCLSAFCFAKKKSTNAPTRTQHVIAGKRGRIWRSKTNHFFLSQSNTERKADKLLVPLLFSITHSVTQKKSAEKKTQKKNRKKLTRTKQVSKEKIPQQQGMNSRKQPPFVPPRRSPESTWCQDVIFLVVSIDSSDRLPWQRWSTRSLNTRQIASRPSLRALQDTHFYAPG